MSQTFNLGGLGDNKLTKLIFSNGTANTCSIFLDDNGHLVFEQGANTVTFPLGELDPDKRLAIERGRVVYGKDVVNTGNDDQNQNNLLVSDTTEDALISAVEDALGVENLFSAKSEPQAGDGVYPGFANAMYFNGSNYLTRTPSETGNRRTYTVSTWLKLLPSPHPSDTRRSFFAACHSSSANNSNCYQVGFLENDSNKFQSGLQNFYLFNSSSQYNDQSAWYHFVHTMDTSNSTTTNKSKVYVNGVELTSFSIDDRSNAQLDSLEMGINLANNPHYIGCTTPDYMSYTGYLANFQMIDGQALDASYFGQYLQVDGEETNIWIPKPLDPSIDYGKNGFYLDFSRNRLNGSGGIDMVYDVAPLTETHTQPNNWTAN